MPKAICGPLYRLAEWLVQEHGYVDGVELINEAARLIEALSDENDALRRNFLAAEKRADMAGDQRDKLLSELKNMTKLKITNDCGGFGR